MRIYLWLLFIVMTFSQCGIYSFTGASIPLEVQTISIDYFPNHAELVNPALSDLFTEALKDRFLSQSNLALTNSDGDWDIKGAITNYVDRPSAVGASTSSLNRLTITVRVEFIDNTNIENSFEKSFSQYLDYDGSASLSDVEDGLVEDINKELINDIFNKIAVNW